MTVEKLHVDGTSRFVSPPVRAIYCPGKRCNRLADIGIGAYIYIDFYRSALLKHQFFNRLAIYSTRKNTYGGDRKDKIIFSLALHTYVDTYREFERYRQTHSKLESSRRGTGVPSMLLKSTRSTYRRSSTYNRETVRSYVFRNILRRSR